MTYEPYDRDELPLLAWVMKRFSWQNYGFETAECAKKDEWANALAQQVQSYLSSRLLPLGGVKTAEYGVPDQDVPIQHTLGAMTLDEATAKAAKTGRPVVIRYVTKWDDGRYHIEPWQPL